MEAKKLRKMECPECKGIVRADATKCVHCSSSFEIKTNDKLTSGLFILSFIVSIVISNSIMNAIESLGLADFRTKDGWIGLVMALVMASIAMYFYLKKVKKRHDDKFVYIDDEECKQEH